MNETDGLIYACQLDGQGGGAPIGWSEIRSWTPREAGPIWIHLDYSAPRSKSWLLDNRMGTRQRVGGG